MSMVNDLTKRPICQSCKTNELTEQEERMGSVCWYCKASRVIEMAQKKIDDLPLPDPVKHGRPDIDLADYEKRKTLDPQPAAVSGENETVQVPGAKNSTKAGTKKNYTPEEKEHFMKNFGIDLDATLPQTEIIVFGTDERTYLKLAMPVPVTSEAHKELQSLLEAVLGQVGATLLYGRHFKDAIEKLKNNIPGLGS